MCKVEECAPNKNEHKMTRQTMNYAICDLSNRPHRAKRRSPAFKLTASSRTSSYTTVTWIDLKLMNKKSAHQSLNRTPLHRNDNDVENDEIRRHTLSNREENASQVWSIRQQSYCWWIEMLNSWSSILLLFLIQFTPTNAALESSSRNLIRFNIDQQSTYSFGGLYTTPMYGWTHTTNSLMHRDSIPQHISSTHHHQSSSTPNIISSSSSFSINTNPILVTRDYRTFRTSTTTSTLAKKIINKILTANKRIPSIEFDKQISWLPLKSDYKQQAYKNNIDFNFLDDHQPATNKLTYVMSNKLNSTMSTAKIHSFDQAKSSTNSFELVTVSPSNFIDRNTGNGIFKNSDNTKQTTRASLPFTSTTINLLHFDYPFSQYDKLMNQTLHFSLSPLLDMTTKLPRIKKHLKDNNSKAFAQTLFDPIGSRSDVDELKNTIIGHKESVDQVNKTRLPVFNPTHSTDANSIIYNDSIKLDSNLSNIGDMNEIYDTLFIVWLGQYIPHPSLEKLIITIAQVICLIFTIVGNVLVIISIFTYNPLRNVQNMFLVSLAVSDITVAICILPLNIGYYLIEKWVFGIHLCKFWLTSDVLCCTASILNLCAIAVDRYQAIHDPINYRMKRTTKRVLLTIVFVWVLSAVTSIPPLFGWNDWPDEFTPEVPCRLTSEKGYVVFSSSVSFYIPLIIMTTVYIKIYKSAKKRLRKRAQSTGRASLKRTVKSGAFDVKQYPTQQYLVDGKLIEVNEGQAAILQSYLEKGTISADNENKLYVQLAAANQTSGILIEDNRTVTDGLPFQQGHFSSSMSHLPSNLKSDSGTGSSTAAVIRVTNLLGAIKGSRRKLTDNSRQRQYSVTEPNTSSSNDEVIFDYATANDAQHNVCLIAGKQLNTIEYEPASLPANTDVFKDGKSFNRNKVKRQSTPEEASDSSESLVDKDAEFSSNNGPSNDYQQQQPTATTQNSAQQPSIAKSFKNRFQHSIFHHQPHTSSSTPPTTLSVHYSSSQASGFSNSSSAFNQQPVQHTKFSSFNLLRRYRSRFHRANNATCFSNFEASSHSRPSIGVVSATSTPEITSPSGNHSPMKDQLPQVKEEPTTKKINRNYLSATFKSTTCSALSKIASNKNKHMTSSLHQLNIVPATIHRTKSEDANNNFGLLRAVSQKLLEEQQNLDEEQVQKEVKLRHKSFSQTRLSIGSISKEQEAEHEGANIDKMRAISNSCLNVYQSRTNSHRDSTTSNSNQKTSDGTMRTSSIQTGTVGFTSSSGPSSAIIQPEKTSQNSNVSSHSNNSNAISECNQRCLSPTTLLQLPKRRSNHSPEPKNQPSSGESNRQGTSSNSQTIRNHSSNSNYYSSTYSTTSTSVMTTSQMQYGAHGSVTTDQSGTAGSSYNQSMRHMSNAYSNISGSHSMVKQVWDQKQRISLSKERKAAQVLGIVMGAFVVSWFPFFLVYLIVPFCPSLGLGQCALSEFTQMIITWLGYINSSINPIIYTVFNMDFRVAFKRILMKCCCAGKLRKQQKLYQQQQQIKLNKRKEHKKKKLLHQQQKQKLREQKNIEGDKDSYDDTTGRKFSFQENRKSSLKQMNNNRSIKKADSLKKVRLENAEHDLEIMAINSNNVSKVLAGSVNQKQSFEQFRKLSISNSCDNLNSKIRSDRLVKSSINKPLTNRLIFNIKEDNIHNLNMKKSHSEMANITTILERSIDDESSKIDMPITKESDNNNNDLNDIIIKTNLKQLESQHPDYCHFKI